MAAGILLGTAVLALCTIRTVTLRDVPGDEDLSANFFAHEAGFDELLSMLHADREVLYDTRDDVIDLAALRTILGHERAEQYVDRLKQISAADLRFFPASGRLILLPTGAFADPDLAAKVDSGAKLDIDSSAKSYLYLPRGQSEPLARYSAWHWRGPGIYFLTDDRPLTQRWFIHRSGRVAVAYSPY